MLPIFKQTIYNIRQPELARQQVDEIIANVLTAAHVAPDPVPNRYLANCVSFMKSQFSRVFQLILPKFVPMLMPSIIGLNILGRFANDKNESEHGVANTVLEILRGLPRNVTTEMDLALWDTAKQIINDAAALQHFQSCSAQALASDYLAGRLPNISQNAVAGFMHRYGMRGVGEFDFGQARWREAPEPVMHTLQSYLQITPEFAPDMLFAKGEKAAEQAIQTLADHASQQHGGKIKAKMVRGLARRVRMWLGTRESPKFFIIQLMGIARQALLQVGQAYVNEGILHRPDDLFFLSLAELEKLSAMPTPLTSKLEWQSLISDRRASHAREARRNQVPRVLVSDGRAFYEGLGNTTDQNDIITGSPVSPGVVEGVVHVVFDPRVTQLAPGEILVCPGTDPAWTPLFMTAGGLVTEVGGMMTHGSVVAREYGIPAVVGVHMATTRLKNGQRIRLDGASGKIVLLEGAPA
jgi:pyruvate,water dikinase